VRNRRQPFPEPNDVGNYPLEALDVVMAQEIIRASHKLGLSQAELARRAGNRVETLNRIEKGKHSPTLRTMQKIDQALKGGKEASAWAKASLAFFRIRSLQLSWYAP
jgi:transcriptional regulator with XRE-family HTH domain